MQPLAPAVLASAAFLFALPLAAQVLRVPGQYPTITAALAAAGSGSTILVGPGTYTENLVWPGDRGRPVLEPRVDHAVLSHFAR